MIIKPNINPNIDRFLFFSKDSGKSSPVATNIIAPAAKDNKKGKILLTNVTNIAPITAEIGSTRADKDPNIKLLFLEIPSFLSGRDTAAPSGKFWIPIPKASITAPIKGTPRLVILPNATPIARPSGILWIVIALTNNILLFNESFFIFLFFFKIILSKNLSDKSTNKPPITKPKAGNNHFMYPNFSDNSSEGIINDQKDAAIIIPAENPSTVSSTFLLIFLKKKTVKAPNTVIPHVNNPAINALSIVFKLLNQINLFTPIFYIYDF